ncbi:MAG: QueT transporter family protein [Eubacteriales bacterium]|nr:QueT transporter family protein [Eubacteriales bacterium]
MKLNIRSVSQAAIIAALYCALTLVIAPIAFGPLQFRVSEALMLLTACMPAAIPGVTLGCFLANLLNPNNLGPIDIFGGTLATFLAAILTYALGRRFFSDAGNTKKLWSRPGFYLLPLPSIICNGLIVGVYLTPLLLGSGEAWTWGLTLTNMGIFSVCEAVVVYVLGLPLLVALRSAQTREILGFSV